MATYIVQTDDKKKSYQKNYGLPLVNIIPAIVWSIPFHQKLFPNAGGWATFGLCAAFVIVYVVLSYKPFIAAVPCIAGGIMLTAMFWVFPDMIGNTVVRIILKILILAIAVVVELAIFANATVPWLEERDANKPRIIVQK